MATATRTASPATSKARTRRTAGQHRQVLEVVTDAPKVPSQRKAPTTPTTTPDVKDTYPVYYAGMKAPEIRDDLIKAGKLLNGSATAYARKMTEAFNRDVHGDLGMSWPEFVKDVSHDITWNRSVQTAMVKLMTDAGLEVKDVAAAIGVSDRTVARLKVKAGRVNVKRVNGAINAIEAKRRDPSSKATSTTTAGVSGQKFTDAETTAGRAPKRVTGTTDITSVVKAASADALVKALAARSDAKDIVLALLAAAK